MPKNRVFVNNFESICCAGSNSEEIFEAICNQITGISIVKKEIDGRAVAIGKIGFEYKIDELLRAVCSDILAKSNLDDFSSTLLVVGSSVGGMSQSESIFLKDKNYKNINPKLHIIDSIAYRLKKMLDRKSVV